MNTRFFRNKNKKKQQPIIKYRQYNSKRLKKTGSKFLNNQPFNVYFKNHHIIRTQIQYLRSKIIIKRKIKNKNIEIIAHTQCLIRYPKETSILCKFSTISVVSSDKSTRHDQLKK